LKKNVTKRYSTPITPEVVREMATSFNCANQLTKKPREFILTLNGVKRKGGVVGVRVFPDAHLVSLFSYEKKCS
jgi:hypothetical protein